MSLVSLSGKGAYNIKVTCEENVVNYMKLLWKKIPMTFTTRKYLGYIRFSPNVLKLSLIHI